MYQSEADEGAVAKWAAFVELPTETARGNAEESARGDTSGEDPLWSAKNAAIREVPSRDHVVVMMDAHARVGNREDGCGDVNMMGAKS